MGDFQFLYVTAPDATCAHEIASALVDERLAACVNVLPAITSVYRWDGAVETAEETPLLVKTTSALGQAAQARIVAMHPYDTPCVAALAISADGSNPAFLKWISQAVDPG